MRVITRGTLAAFWENHADAKDALSAWHAEAKRARWKTPADILAVYRSADILSDNRVVFNIKGNRYRLVVKIQYSTGTIYIRFIGTHAEYDRINAETI